MPARVGALRYATLHTWQTDGFYFANVGFIDKVEIISIGGFYETGRFRSLNLLHVEGGLVALGTDDYADIISWRISHDAEVLLYRYALSRYPLCPESEDEDAEATTFVETLRTESKLIDYRGETGKDVRKLHFRG